MESCSACGKAEPVTKGKGAKKAKKNNQTIGWISCDHCQKWFHTVCVRIGDQLLPEISNCWYFCESCTVIGSLIAKPPSQPSAATATDLQAATAKVADLSAELEKLKSELHESRAASKKQVDRLRSQLNDTVQRNSQTDVQKTIVNNLQQKLEVIESGVKMANTCSLAANSYRLAINKIPVRDGENVRSIVENFLSFLGMDNAVPHVTSSFRLPPRPSKWTDRSLSPTIIIVFDQREIKDNVLRKYFQRHRDAKLSVLQLDLPLENRFTVNEALPVQAFRIRNLALRLKQKKLIDSVFVKDGSISVRLPRQKSYIPVQSTDHLLQLTQQPNNAEESAIFFDAESGNASFASQL